MISRRQIIEKQQVREKEVGVGLSQSSDFIGESENSSSLLESPTNGRQLFAHKNKSKNKNKAHQVSNKSHSNGRQLAERSAPKEAPKQRDNSLSIHGNLLGDALNFSSDINKLQDEQISAARKVFKGIEQREEQEDFYRVDEPPSSKMNAKLPIASVQKMAKKLDEKTFVGQRRGKPVAEEQIGYLDDKQNFDPYSVYGEDEDEEEDIWYSEERLLEDHIQEIADKWFAIDDEIWAKIICMERNRRIAKAYARKLSVTVNGSEENYLDGRTLGLNSFDNPDRDSKTSNVKQYIGGGVKIKINPAGDIFIKRLSKANVFVHQLASGSTRHQTAALRVGGNKVGDDSSTSAYARDESLATIGATTADLYYGLSSNAMFAGKRVGVARKANGAKSSDQSLSSSGNSSAYGGGYSLGSAITTSSSLMEFERVVRVFNMDKFKGIVERESRRPYPNRLMLRNMCISVVSFVIDDTKLLNLPSWIIVINMVAIDLISRKVGLGNELNNARALGAQHSLLNHRAHLSAFNDGPKSSLDLRHHEEDKSYGKFNGHPQWKPQANRQHQLSQSASRLGSSNCYASGNKWEGGHYFAAGLDEETSRVLGSSSKLNFRSNSEFFDLDEGELKAANSDGAEVGHSDEQVLFCSEGRRGLEPSRAMTGAGSSSSGFNSNSSLQMNDADESSGAGESNGSSVSVDQTDRLGSAAKKSPPRRGLRPPKLPHGLANDANLVSEPIPIPAPPTSGGGPSGKANLILVSPTGLSPPLPKRELKQSGVHRQAGKSGPSSDAQTSCKTLPVAIPKNAQLAPPATQRHILRYLMSTVVAGSVRPTKQKASLAQSKFGERQQSAGAIHSPVLHQQHLIKAANDRLQRPLPVLPGPHQCAGELRSKQAKMVSQVRDNRSDESLYHSGLMARIPRQNSHHSASQQHSARPRPINTANGYHYPITKSAIDAILTDFRLQSHNQFNYAQHYRDQSANSEAKKQQQQSSTKHRLKQPLKLANLKLLSSNLSSSASALVQNGLGRGKKAE